jgi:ABC-type sugar transport system ATPase subunit
MAIIAAKGIEKRYDGVHALKSVDIEVEEGEVHALVGENGAGKSTLGKIIAGVVRPDQGKIILNDKVCSIHNPLDAQKLGIGIIFQELDLFPNLTVGENIVIGNLGVKTGTFVNQHAVETFCRPFLSQVGLGTCPTTRLLDDLQIAEMQLVAIARALSMKARIIVMDEPTSSLPDDAVENLFGLIRNLRTSGVSVIYVSHKMKEIFAIADRITVLRDGEVVGTKNASETNIDQIISMMVGRELTSVASSEKTYGETLLDVQNLNTQKLREISFSVREGEVLGIAGLVGAGRSELGAALFGLDRVNSGSIKLGGREIHPKNPQRAIQQGIGLLPEDRKLQGLCMQGSVRENSTLAIIKKLQVLGFIQHGRETREMSTVLDKTRLKAASYEASVSSLSGGNQQKVLLAKWLLTDPRLIFLDDPTRGIDIGAKHDIYELIADLASKGKGVIFVSSELPELLRCSDKIMVMSEGRIAGFVDARTTTQDEIMGLAAKPLNA